MKDEETVGEFYNERFNQRGENIESIGWGSYESQQLRFKILTEIADLEDQSICDLGCGFGDLYQYLEQNYSKFSYCGIDLSDKLLSVGRKNYPDVTFERKNILKEDIQGFDYVISSGALTYRIENHMEYVERMVKRMFEICQKGIAVNFLSTYVDYQLDKNFHLAPETAFAMAQKLSRWATIRQDYSLFEFTLYIYKNPTQ